MSEIEVRIIEFDTHLLDKFALMNGMSIGQALNATAHQVEGVAKTLAPVDTGALKNSLNTQREAEHKYIVADGVEYGIYQELGTKRMAAHPFLIPALEKVRDFIVQAVEKEFGKILK